MFGVRLISGIILIIIAFFTMGLGGWELAVALLLISLIAYRELTKALMVADKSTDRGRCGDKGNNNDKIEDRAIDKSAGKSAENDTDKSVGGSAGNDTDGSTGGSTGRNHGGIPGRFNLLEIVGLLGVVIYYAVIYFSGDPQLILMDIVGMFMMLMLVYVVTFPRFNAGQVMGAFFAFVYAPVMLSFVYLTRMNSGGHFMVWLILISAWGSDTCAYVVGRLIGKHKIFPLLSPKKSLEGCIGGVLGAALLGFLYGVAVTQVVFSEQRIPWLLAFICGVGAIMSQAGDLAASAIKRNHNIKDYGNLIPGHGGIMDRFDSMIVTAPMIYFLTILLVNL